MPNQTMKPTAPLRYKYRHAGERQEQRDSETFWRATDKIMIEVAEQFAPPRAMPPPEDLPFTLHETQEWVFRGSWANEILYGGAKGGGSRLAGKAQIHTQRCAEARWLFGSGCVSQLQKPYSDAARLTGRGRA